MCQAELWIFITTLRLLPRVFYHSLSNNSILSFNGECLIVNLVGFDYDYAVVCHEVIFFLFLLPSSASQYYLNKLQTFQLDITTN